MIILKKYPAVTFGSGYETIEGVGARGYNIYYIIWESLREKGPSVYYKKSIIKMHYV